MIGKARTNIRAEIDAQYEILSQMIEDIADRYQEDELRFEKYVDRMAEEGSEGDEDIKHTIQRSFDASFEKQYSLTYEARKILFCTIFSYFETMLHGLKDYFKIPVENPKYVNNLVEAIKREYKERYSELFPDYGYTETIICTQYRILRNYFMHGELEKDSDKELLRSYALSESGLRCYEWDKYVIESNDFLIVALDRINGFLVRIEEAYCKKEKECNWKNINNY
jgi:hypothetical protein